MKWITASCPFLLSRTSRTPGDLPFFQPHGLFQFMPSDIWYLVKISCRVLQWLAVAWVLQLFGVILFMFVIVTTSALAESPLKLHFRILIVLEISTWALSTSHLQKRLAVKFIVRQRSLCAKDNVLFNLVSTSHSPAPSTEWELNRCVFEWTKKWMILLRSESRTHAQTNTESRRKKEMKR